MSIMLIVHQFIICYASVTAPILLYKHKQGVLEKKTNIAKPWRVL